MRWPFVSRKLYEFESDLKDSANESLNYASGLNKALERERALLLEKQRTINGRVELMRKACLILDQGEGAFTNEEISLIRTMAQQFTYGKYGDE